MSSVYRQTRTFSWYQLKLQANIKLLKYFQKIQVVSLLELHYWTITKFHANIKPHIAGVVTSRPRAPPPASHCASTAGPTALATQYTQYNNNKHFKADLSEVAALLYFLKWKRSGTNVGETETVRSISERNVMLPSSILLRCLCWHSSRSAALGPAMSSRHWFPCGQQIHTLHHGCALIVACKVTKHYWVLILQ